MTPQEELPILENIVNIRNRLTALKKDSTEFIKPQDVYKIYNDVIKQVNNLNEIRRDEVEHTQNRLDTTLADVFSLLSLFFLTIGRTKECPAIYCQIASMRQILDHMVESSVYSEADLRPFHSRLAELRQIVKDDAENQPSAMIQLIERKLNQCEALVRNMHESLSVLSVELVPIHQRLVSLRRQLVALAAKEHPSKTELKNLMEELRKIDAKRVDGKFLGPGGTSVPASQAVCSSLLEECYEIAHETKARGDSLNVSEPLRPVYERLQAIRTELEKLSLTHRWTLKETDLYNYTVALADIDRMRKDGRWGEVEEKDQEGEKKEGENKEDDKRDRITGQYVLLYVLRRCYGLIYKLLSSSEPVSEELMPIANKLSTVKKCLNEVLKYGGPYNPRELYPYQLALFQIDSMRKDGKFLGRDGSVPEGQGIVMAHLNECHELLEMLKETMEERGDEEDEYTDGGDAVYASGEEGEASDPEDDVENSR